MTIPSTPGAFIGPSGDTTGAADTGVFATVQTQLGAGGGIIELGPGTYWSRSWVLQSNIILQGAGRGATVLKLASGVNADVIQGAGFGALTLSGSTGGIGQWGIRDLAIDGNKASQSGTSYGVRVYGYEFDISRVSIRNCLTDGLYTEWGSGAGATPDASMEANLTFLKIHDCGGNGWVNRGPHDLRAYDLTIFHNGASSYGYWGAADTGTPTVAAGSNGVNVATFTGAGVLNVSTTLGFPAASISATQGSITVVTSGVNAVITYTGTTATTFTGCMTISGSGTVSTGNAVTATGGGFTSAGSLLEAVHVYGAPLYDYVLDTQTHLIDCIGEAAGTGGATVLARGNITSQIIGGLYIVYAGEPTGGCGIQIGDATNPCIGLRANTWLSGFAGSSAATAAVNIVSDGGNNSVDALVYQPSGTAVFGAFTNTSRYQVHPAGQSLAANAPSGLDVATGQFYRYVPPAASKGFTVAPAGASDAVNLNTSANRLDHNNGLADAWWAANYTTQTAGISGATGAVQPGTSAGLGGHLFSGSGAPNITGSVAGDYYLRTDTPSTANQRLYVATGANTWTGIV